MRLLWVPAGVTRVAAGFSKYNNKKLQQFPGNTQLLLVPLTLSINKTSCDTSLTDNRGGKKNDNAHVQGRFYHHPLTATLTVTFKQAVGSFGATVVKSWPSGYLVTGCNRGFCLCLAEAAGKQFDHRTPLVPIKSERSLRF